MRFTASFSLAAQASGWTRGSAGFNQGWGFVKPLGQGREATGVGAGDKTVAGYMDRQAGNCGMLESRMAGQGKAMIWSQVAGLAEYLVGARHHCQHGPW